jgi:calcineurin B family protein 1
MGNRLSMASFLSTGTIDAQDVDYKELNRETGFTYGQIEQLNERFHELVPQNSYQISRKDIEKLLQNNPLKDRISDVFIGYAEVFDEMTFKEFVKTMAKFRTTIGETKERSIKKKVEKLQFAFRLYDIDNDGVIRHEEICEILHKLVGNTSSVEEIEKMADQMIIEMDKDGDHEISFKDFCDSFSGVEINDKLSLPFLKRNN